MFGHYKNVLGIYLPHFIPHSLGTMEQITFFFFVTIIQFKSLNVKKLKA